MLFYERISRARLARLTERTVKSRWRVLSVTRTLDGRVYQTRAQSRFAAYSQKVSRPCPSKIIFLIRFRFEDGGAI